jgi:dihydropteroate synthase
VRRESVFRVKDTAYVLGRRTWVMGIVNVTPDSFYDGGLYLDAGKAVAHGLELAAEGADILDIGGESSRPGSDPTPAEDELHRVVPVIAGLRRQSGTLLSVDTMKPDIAEAALDAGADIINDVSSFRLDPRILELAARRKAGFIVMHMAGTPKTMQIQPRYDDVIGDVLTFLAEKLEIAEAYGLDRECLMIDPGIGFGKRFEDNLALINGLATFEDLGRPVLIGVSRKSFIGKILNAPPEDRLEGTIAASVVGVVRGAHVLRVHDVRAVKRAIQVAEAILGGTTGQTRPEEKGKYVQ